MQKIEDVFLSISQAAKFCHLQRQSIFVAMKKGRLKAEKKEMIDSRGRRVTCWGVYLSDLQAYRASKYIRENRIVDGEKLFELGKHNSVLQVSKLLTKFLGRKYSTHRIYYLIRRGELRASKRASAWIISGEDAQFLYEREADILKIRVI